MAALSALGKSASLNPRHVPIIIHAQPEAASIGCYAGEAHEAGFHGVEGRFEIDRANTGGGFAKVAADKRTGKVIGAQIVGDRASESISVAVLAVKKGLTVKTLAQMNCGWSSSDRKIQEAARSCMAFFKNRKITI